MDISLYLSVYLFIYYFTLEIVCRKNTKGWFFFFTKHQGIFDHNKSELWILTVKIYHQWPKNSLFLAYNFFSLLIPHMMDILALASSRTIITYHLVYILCLTGFIFWQICGCVWSGRLFKFTFNNNKVVEI